MANKISNITQALAAETAAASLPATVDVKLERGALTAKNILAHTGLPTPPNSISPSLPPHSFAAKASKELALLPPAHIDSDIDLQDAVDHANSQDQRQLSASPGDSGERHGNITPAYLAMHHLPDIVLDKGPVAIRHLMMQLAHNVPGFSDIPPAKARRIVVSALEGRAGGGLHGDVEFEKVGWGRWDARLKGDRPKDARSIFTIVESRPSVSRTPTGALRIPNASVQRPRMRRVSHGSWVASTVVSPALTARSGADDDIDMMSIDGESEDRFRKYTVPQAQDDCYSDTDEEDWASAGPGSLLQSSLPHHDFRSFSLSRRASARLSISGIAKSMPANARPHYFARKSSTYSNLDFTGVEANNQEREAIEALMRMGSM